MAVLKNLNSPSSHCRTRGLAKIFLLFAAACFLGGGRASAQFALLGQPQQDIVAMYFFNGQDEATFKKQLEVRSSLQLKRVSKLAELDTGQVKKLEFALRGDLNRFYRELDDVREKTKDLNMQDQQEMQEAWQIISPLYERVHQGNIIGDDSLFERVLSSTLDDEQAAEYEDYLKERNAYQMQSIVEITLSDVEKSVPLTAKQRDGIVELVRKQKLPRSIQRGMESYMGHMVLAKLTRQEVSKILDEKQTDAFIKIHAQFAGFGGVEW